jgi:hypothetical protein
VFDALMFQYGVLEGNDDGSFNSYLHFALRKGVRDIFIRRSSNGAWYRYNRVASQSGYDSG